MQFVKYAPLGYKIIIRTNHIYAFEQVHAVCLLSTLTAHFILHQIMKLNTNNLQVKTVMLAIALWLWTNNDDRYTTWKNVTFDFDSFVLTDNVVSRF